MEVQFHKYEANCAMNIEPYTIIAFIIVLSPLYVTALLTPCSYYPGLARMFSMFIIEVGSCSHYYI